MEIAAFADPAAWVEFSTVPVIPLRSVSLELLRPLKVALICPEIHNEPNTSKVLQWKAKGLLPDTQLVMGTYKTIHKWNPSTDRLASLWIAHSHAEIKRTGSKRMKVIDVPISILEPIRKPAGEYVFVGGRKERDHSMAYKAIVKSGLPGMIVTDKWRPPRRPSPKIEHKQPVTLPEYNLFLHNARCVVVPVKPGLNSRGHCDVVRALQAGKPVVVTKGATCETYVSDGKTGYLVDYSVDAMCEGIKKAWKNSEFFSGDCTMRGLQCTPKQFAKNLINESKQLL